eukprot:INCI19685.2.p1 GENE.INCI19685.2~~INCI19685.2.p1  ORF type:complete len:477 (-),score=113.30 INCI19685.2:1400-2830(-)
MSFAVTNFDAVRRPLKVKVRLFEAAGWNRHPKEIINVDYTLRRRISNVRFDNLPIGIPLYLHVSGDVILADADEHGLISGVEQFLGQRAQVRLVARVPPQQPDAQRAPTQVPRQAQQQPRTRPEWATGPRRFQKMHSLASRQSLVALGEYEGAITSLETRATAALGTLARHLDGTASADLEKLKESLYEIDDELEALRSSKLNSVDLDGLQSGAELATEKKKRLIARAAALSQRVRGALTHPVFPPDSDSDDDAPSLEECEEEDEQAEEGGLSAEEEPQEKEAGSASVGGANKAEDAAAQAESAASPADVPDLAPTATLEKPRTSFNTAASPGASAEQAEAQEEGEEQKPAVIAPPAFGKQYSTLSQQRMVKLADIRDRVDVIASEYEGMLKLVETLDTSTDEGVEALAKVKNECAQLYGNLEKLQFKEIDGVLVGDLTSGQSDARTARKQLTRDVSDLSDRIKATVQELKNQLAK